MTEHSSTTVEQSLAERIVGQLKLAGVDIVASLPDQWLVDLIDQCEADPTITHVKLAREDDGVGVCAGAYLGGRRAALICQNAGVLLSTNALGAMAYHHQIPLIVLAAQRGKSEDRYFYQLYKGRVTCPVLEGLGVPYYTIDGREHIPIIEEGARQAFLSRQPLIFLMRRRALVDGPGVKS